ncbi:MAG: patatin-like phospholipase family protein [Rhodoferax sp.]|nr:patatin-like phospholipase family protein [Rhodoferax sp.]
MKAKNPQAPRIALALAGGGPLGAIYEVGAMCALEESLLGMDFTKLHHYVGVSAGAFIAASLANGMTPRELCAAFIDNEPATAETFDPSWLMKPAYGEFARRGRMLPGLLAGALWQLAFKRKSLTSAFESLAPALPTGAFSNRQVNDQLARLFSSPGRSNDFRQLKSKLTLVATNLDSSEPTPFGRPGWDHIPISQAVQASSALPGLFPPVEIEGQHYVDGALKKTMHASVALDDGVDLLICLNPLVPFDATAPLDIDAQEHLLPSAQRRIPRIVEGGLTSVLSQTFRSMIHSRMELGMKHYATQYPETDIVLIEPDHRDPELYLANTFSYSQRRHLAEHAYQQTRALLRSDATGLSAKLQWHGIRLNHAALDDPKRRLAQPERSPTRIGRSIASLQQSLNDLSDFTASRLLAESH